MNEYLVPWWNVNLGLDEADKVKKSILNRNINQGLITEELEEKLSLLLKIPYVVLTTNGSIALLLSLLACDIKAGDEVIIPAFTFIATAQAPLLLGARVKLVDVESSRPVIDIKKIERSITSKTKAIIAVHLNGRAADIQSINRLAKKYGLKVIEDSVQALCSRNQFGYLGTQSDMGVFSLGITKLITAGEGGFVVTKNRNIFKKLQKIRNHGLTSKFIQRYEIMGFNFKFNDILASLGACGIKKVKRRMKALESVYSFYKKEIDGLKYIKIMPVDLVKGELPLWAEAICFKRSEVIRLLDNMGIQAKEFPQPLCSAPYIKNKGDFKWANFYSKHGLILPCGPDQPMHNLKLTAEALKDICSKL